jgi:hypothetical protein
VSRRFASLLVGLSFLAVGVTGVLSFALPWGDRLSGLHTVAGFIFLGAGALHVTHNARAWLRYAADRSRRLPSARLVVALGLCAALLAGALWRVRPLSSLLAWGRALRDADAPARTGYQSLTLDTRGDGPLVVVDLKAGPHFHTYQKEFGWDITPQIAVWTEDEQGRYLETLYVTRDEGRDGYDDGDGRTLSPRPASLPVWRHKLGLFSDPQRPEVSRHAPLPDAVSGASPTDNSYLTARAHGVGRRFAVLVEVNSSWDYNDYYTFTAFPDEPMYVNGGNPAQPSVVYRALVDRDARSRFTVASAIGHGHHGGANGIVDPDFSHLTTALAILDRVVVEVRD